MNLQRTPSSASPRGGGSLSIVELCPVNPPNIAGGPSVMQHFVFRSASSLVQPNNSRLLLKAAVIITAFASSLVPVLAEQAVPQIGVKKPSAAPGTLVIPPSSQINVEDRSKRAHTNVRFIVPATSCPLEEPPYAGFGYETPASLACIYRQVAPIRGCNPNSTVNTPMGGSETIAIVDAFDDPSAAADLAYFSAQFGIPFSPSKFKVVYAGGSAPPVDTTGGWELEEALDVEYSHAMAPKAMLYLVEADSNSFTDLFAAVDVATNLVRCGHASAC